MTTGTRIRRWLPGLLLVVFCLGCSSLRPKQVAPNLQVTREGDTMILSWPSVAGKTYTVLYTESLRDPEWRPLPGHRDLVGTGGELTVRDTIASPGVRFYRLDAGTGTPREAVTE